MTTKLKWRLTKLPTPLEISTLVNDKIISQEEAKGILFSDDENDDSEALKSEIKFLRGLVEKLSNGSYNRITEYVYQWPKPNAQWYQPYVTWCTSAGGTTTSSASQLTYYSSGTASLDNGQLATLNNVASGASLIEQSNFSDIKTF